MNSSRLPSSDIAIWCVVMMTLLYGVCCGQCIVCACSNGDSAVCCVVCVATVLFGVCVLTVQCVCVCGDNGVLYGVVAAWK